MNSTILESTESHGSSKISVNSIEIVLIFFFLLYNLSAFNAYLNTCYFIIYLIHSSSSSTSDNDSS